jgi:hypothetical protein
MMEEAITDHNHGEPIKRDICPRCKKVYLDDYILCARCSESLAHYLGSHLYKPPDWFVKKLSQLINVDRILYWCPRCRTLHEGESQLCDACKQQIDVDKVQRWLHKVRRKQLNGMKSGSNVE